MIADVVEQLRCPACGGALTLSDGGSATRCGEGHSFDLARQGYLNLIGSSPDPGTGDDSEMIAARERFLAGGHFLALTEELAKTASDHSTSRVATVIDAGAGTGHYLAATLRALENRPAGIALDLSRPALRRAARAHPRIGAVACNLWQSWPVADDCAGLIISAFAPRNPDEAARVLAPHGTVVVMTPAPGHLAEASDELGLLRIEADKLDRLDRDMEPHFALVARASHRHTMLLGQVELADLVAMGPNAHHRDRDTIEATLRTRPGPRQITAATTLSVYRLRPNA